MQHSVPNLKLIKFQLIKNTELINNKVMKKVFGHFFVQNYHGFQQINHLNNNILIHKMRN